MRIEIDGLEVRAVIGVLDFERRGEQIVRVSLSIDGDWSAAAASDDLASTIDYTELADLARRTLVEGRFRLLESAVGALHAALSALPSVTGCRVAIEKPGAVPDARVTRVSSA